MDRPKKFELQEANFVYSDQMDQRKLFEVSENSGYTTSSYAQLLDCFRSLRAQLESVTEQLIAEQQRYFDTQQELAVLQRELAEKNR